MAETTDLSQDGLGLVVLTGEQAQTVRNALLTGDAAAGEDAAHALATGGRVGDEIAASLAELAETRGWFEDGRLDGPDGEDGHETLHGFAEWAEGMCDRLSSPYTAYEPDEDDD